MIGIFEKVFLNKLKRYCYYTAQRQKEDMTAFQEDLVLLDRELHCKTIENKTIERVDMCNVLFRFSNNNRSSEQVKGAHDGSREILTP